MFDPSLNKCHQLPVRQSFVVYSGGAIFHTGSLRVSNTMFTANVVGADGPAIMSIGPLEQLSNVSFSENEYHCPPGQYAYILAMEQVRNTLSIILFM